jgi:hypothetical protein
MARVRKPGTPANAKNVSFLRNKAKEQKEARLQDLESLGARPQAWRWWEIPTGTLSAGLRRNWATR